MRVEEAKTELAKIFEALEIVCDDGSPEELHTAVLIAKQLVGEIDTGGPMLPLKVLDAIWSCFTEGRWDFTDENFDLAIKSVMYLFQDVYAEIYGVTRDEFPEPLKPDDTTGDTMVYLRPLFDVGRYPMICSMGDRFRLSFTPDNYEPLFTTFEHMITRILCPPFDGITCGGPYDPFGMARVIAGDQWRQVVVAALCDASFILMYPSSTLGIQWELEQIRDLDLRGRTCIVMMMEVEGSVTTHPYFEGDRSVIPNAWDNARHVVGEFLDVSLPEYNSQGAFFFLNDSGEIEHLLPMKSCLDHSFRDYVRSQYGSKDAMSKKYDPQQRWPRFNPYS